MAAGRLGGQSDVAEAPVVGSGLGFAPARCDETKGSKFGAGSRCARTGGGTGGGSGAGTSREPQLDASLILNAA
jgi:hypothetical protein